MLNSFNHRRERLQNPKHLRPEISWYPVCTPGTMIACGHSRFATAIALAE